MTFRSLLGAACLLLCCVAASATTFTFSVTSNGLSGSGTLTGTVDPYNSSAYDITSATGTYGGYALSLVQPSGNSQTTEYDGVYYYDNVLFTSGNPFTTGGLLFNLGTSGNVLNLYYSGGVVTQSSNPNTVPPIYAATFQSSAAAATPEPSALVLAVTGLLGLAAMGRRRLGFGVAR